MDQVIEKEIYRGYTEPYSEVQEETVKEVEGGEFCGRDFRKSKRNSYNRHTNSVSK